jgi:cardiolipin synthase
VGSTNLNIASWMGNWELDIVIEDEGVGPDIETMYTRDLERSTELVLSRRARTSRPRTGRRARARRAAAGALRLGNIVGAALGRRRVLGAAEARVMLPAGVVLLAISVAAILWPRVVAFPLAALAIWIGTALVINALRSTR